MQLAFDHDNRLLQVFLWKLHSNADYSWKRLLQRDPGNQLQVREELDLEASVVCITQHPGYNSVCLDPWVLETATNAVRQSYGSDHVASQAGHSQNE